ncbi:unnamed protein product, partial [Meganyctiphanes norvegica]
MAPMLAYERGAPYYDRGPPPMRESLQDYLKVPPREPLQDYFRVQRRDHLQDYLKVPPRDTIQDYVRPTVRQDLADGRRRGVAALDDTYNDAQAVYHVRQRPSASSPTVVYAPNPLRRSRSSVGHMTRPMHLLRGRDCREALSTSPFRRELGYYSREDLEGAPGSWSSSLRRDFASSYRRDPSKGLVASWSASSVPDVLHGGKGGVTVPFRFCPSLSACHIPRASVRISRKNAI